MYMYMYMYIHLHVSIFSYTLLYIFTYVYIHVYDTYRDPLAMSQWLSSALDHPVGRFFYSERKVRTTRIEVRIISMELCVMIYIYMYTYMYMVFE
jgi:hypothetical protein